MKLLVASVGFVAVVSMGCPSGEAERTTHPDEEELDEFSSDRTINPAKTGTIEGVVRFEGTTPEREVEDIAGADGCGTDTVELERIVVNEGGTLRWCIASIDAEGLKGYRFTTPKDTRVIDQKGCVYIPHVTTVMTGQPFAYQNSDGALHNIHTLPKRNPERNIASKVGQITKAFKYRRPEIVRVKCDVHPWMSSYVGVFAHPYHAVTDERGAFTLDGVPPGTYTVRLWHEAYGEKEVEVSLGEKETKAVEVVFEGT